MHAIDPDKLEALGESLSKRRDIWVMARRSSGVEKRWLADINQYDGKDDATRGESAMMESVERGFPVVNDNPRPQRSTVFVNITRPKTNAAEARVANMLCPVDDRNWGLKTTPDPKLVKQAKAQAVALAKANQVPALGSQPPAATAPTPQGQPGGAAPQPNGQAQPTNGQSGGVSQATTDLQHAYPNQDAQAVIAEADRCAKAMQDEIDDQLIQCDYLGQQRSMLHDCAMIGTGVLKGPIVVNRVSKVWQPLPGSQPVVHTLEIMEEMQPASERVDPWNVFPDPGCGEDIHNGRGLFEKITYTSKQLRDLSKQPGYLKEQISKVLQEGPEPESSKTRRDAKNNTESGDTSNEKDHFEMWEYWGEFDPEDLRAAGVDIPDGSTDAISGCIVIVNKHVIKGFLNPLDTGDLPYDFMVWEKVDGSCWGYSMPYLMRSPQRVLNAAWRQLMDNAGCSVGPQTVIDPTAIEPADGKWEISGRKIWNKLDSSADIKNVFSMIYIPSNIDDITEIIKLAEQFVDDTSSSPQIAQGEKGTAPDTVGGMTLLMNQANVVLGRIVKRFDDSVSRPHIRRYYDWNMAYNEKPEIKGDFQVDARGSSSLLVRDMMHQTILSLGQYQANGVISPFVNWENWFREMLKMGYVDPTDIMKTETEIAQLQAQPPAATPEQIRANAQLAVAQEKAKAMETVAQIKQQGEIQFANIEQKTAEQDASIRLQELQMKRDLALLEYANQNKLQINEIHSQLAQKAMDHSQERDLAAAEMQMRENESNKDRLHDANLQVHKVMADHIENNADRSRESVVPVTQIQ